MTDEIKEVKAAPVERTAKAGNFFADHLEYIRDKHDCYINSKYLTVDITNGKDVTLKELRQWFPRIKILKLPLPFSGNHFSIYRIDRNILTIENYEKRLKKCTVFQPQKVKKKMSLMLA